MGVPSDLLGRGPLSSSGLRHGAVVTCTECAVGVIDQRAGVGRRAVPSAWLLARLSVPAASAWYRRIGIGARQHQPAAADLGEAAVLVIVPENVVPMLSLSPSAASRSHPRAADGMVEALKPRVVPLAIVNALSTRRRALLPLLSNVPPLKVGLARAVAKIGIGGDRQRARVDRGDPEYMFVPTASAFRRSWRG